MTDHDAIRNLLGKYAQMVDDRRHDELRELFVPDVEVDLAGKVACGVDAVIDLLASGTSGPRQRCHVTVNPIIDVDPSGTRASSTADLVYCSLNTDETWSVLSRGRYNDTFVKRDGRWLIENRRFTVALPLMPHSDVEHAIRGLGPD